MFYFLIMRQTFFQAPLIRDEATGFAGDICCASSRTPIKYKIEMNN
jgi:hypothetical protein